MIFHNKKCFHIIIPFIFSFNDAHEFIGETGRNISFLLQIAFYTVISTYMLYVAHKSSGHQKIRYKAVAGTSIILGIFLIFQISYAFFPSYAIGLMIGISLIHSFVCYQTNDTYGNLEINNSGDDFYSESLANIPLIIHEQDCDKLSEFINKDKMISTMETHKDCSINYRMMVSGKAQYTRMTVRKSSDGSHFIIGIENVDDEIKREKQHLKELKTEKELARRDELTGVKNKTAYKELEASVQGNIDNDMNSLSFAIVVCDTNNLKQINDTQGHAAGDEYLRSSSQLLCDIFVHSPVFRVGGDKFVSDIFDRADKQMYENKKLLKSLV